MVVLRNISQLISNNESLVIGPDVNPAVQRGIHRIGGRDLARTHMRYNEEAHELSPGELDTDTGRL